MKRKDLKNLILKHKKLIALATATVILGSSLILIRLKNDNNSQISNPNIFERTVVLEKGEINNSIIVSGTIKSGEVSNVSASITAKVKSVNVNVGDTVKEGDIICILDDSDIIKEIESKTKSIEEERKSLQDNYNNLITQLDALKSAQAETSKNQESLIEIAASNLNDANSELSKYESTFNSIKNTYNIMLNGIKNKQTDYDNAERDKNKYYEEWIKSGGKVDSKEYKNYIEASKKLDQKQEELDEAKILYDYDNISNKYNEVLAIYNEKVNARDLAKSQHEEALSNSITLANSNKSEIDTLQSTINDINKQIQKLDDNEELKELKENLNKTVLKAETSGKITDLKVNVGSMTDGAIATIQSTDKLILEVNIPEYDIQKVTTGMKVKVSSDTLSNKVNGELVRISPVASSDENGGFSAEISIENGSGLFIGTSAKAEIIISGKDDVIIAPIDAIKNIDANPSILLKDANGEFNEVSVTIGERNDYYVEVSGDNIKEGIEIIADVSSDNIEDNTNLEEEESVNEGF